MRGLLLLPLLAASPMLGQEPLLAPVAERAREAFLEHRFDLLLAEGTSVRLRLPEQRSGAPVRRDVAVAVLQAFARGYVEVEVALLGASILEDRQGYVELGRRFRRAGIPEEQDHRILLSVRQVESRWEVAEVWVSP